MKYEYSEWTQVRVTVKQPHLDTLVAVMSVIDTNLMIEDYSDFRANSVYGELVDESILNADKTIASVSVYLPAEANVAETVDHIRTRLAELSVEGRVEMIGINEEDWANAWKQYFKPLHVGRIVICPTWEDYNSEQGEIKVLMDPGMAFGSGSHETTRLVVGMLDKYLNEGDTVLDVGCGSGILAICASKLGAGQSGAYDIDPQAVEVARENCEVNGCKNITCGVSNLLSGVEPKKYDIICANIVADIIIRMAPEVSEYMKDTTTLICSGIIAERADEVVEALEAGGLYIEESAEDNGWCALAVKKLHGE